jgi:DNA-binding NtrC family response regulator
MLLPVHFEGQRFGLSQQAASIRDASRVAEAHPGNGHAAKDSPRVTLSSFDLSEAESQLIARALEVTEGNRTRAAELLGLSVRTLRNKLNGLPKS